ncbi:MAG: hypothetical protein KF861_24615, partial [Planctomycetaceae bacterium]|nr:hypothetical protein [Planctomycetaceae bacterium]
MKTCWVRLPGALVALGCASVFAVAVNLIRSAAHPSILLIGTAVVVALVGIGATVVAAAPQSVLRKLVQLWSTFVANLQATNLMEDHRRGRRLIGLGFLLFVAIIGRLLTIPDDPWDDDQGAFLITAMEVRDAGGPVGLLGDLFAGRFAEANRHPLYIALLSLRPTVPFGRGLSTALGLLTLSVLTYCVATTRG